MEPDQPSAQPKARAACRVIPLFGDDRKALAAARSDMGLRISTMSLDQLARLDELIDWVVAL